MASSIGSFQFLRLDGAIRVPVQQFDIEVRAGVDGQSIYKTGTRAEPEIATTITETTSEYAAMLLLYSYQQIIGQRVKVVRNDVAQPWLDRVVLDVQPLRVINHIAGHGALGQSDTTITCRWVLLPVEKEAP